MPKVHLSQFLNDEVKQYYFQIWDYTNSSFDIDTLIQLLLSKKQFSVHLLTFISKSYRQNHTRINCHNHCFLTIF